MTPTKQSIRVTHVQNHQHKMLLTVLALMQEKTKQSLHQAQIKFSTAVAAIQPEDCCPLKISYQLPVRTDQVPCPASSLAHCACRTYVRFCGDCYCAPKNRRSNSYAAGYHCASKEVIDHSWQSTHKTPILHPGQDPPYPLVSQSASALHFHWECFGSCRPYNPREGHTAARH
jgi:hypothetical protein